MKFILMQGLDSGRSKEEIQVGGERRYKGEERGDTRERRGEIQGGGERRYKGRREEIQGRGETLTVLRMLTLAWARLAALAVEALRQRGGAVTCLAGLQGQLVGYLEGLAQCQDDLIGQVLQQE